MIDLKSDFKIYWNNSSIAKLVPGKDYLSPNIELLVDDMIEQNQRGKLKNFLEIWLKNKITTILKSLFDLKDIKDKNSSIKALAYQLYENNGVIKKTKFQITPVS